MATFSRTPRSRHLLGVVAAIGFLVPTLHAQSIGVAIGDSVRLQMVPGQKVAIPIGVDLLEAGSLNLASLQARITWGVNRLTFDSVRAVPGTGFSVTENTTNVGDGLLTFSTFGSKALPASGPLAILHFTAGNLSGGSRIQLTPMLAGSEAGTDIKNKLWVRNLGVCIAGEGKWGDVNIDGVVNVIDAQQIARASVGLPILNASALAARGDVTADGSVDIIDAQQIARFVVSLSAAERINTAPAYTPPTAASVTVSPGTMPAVAPGTAVVLTSIARDEAGNDLGGCVPVSWSSGDTVVARVNAQGVVRSASVGAVAVEATAGAAKAPIEVTVLPSDNSGRVTVLSGSAQTGEVGLPTPTTPSVAVRLTDGRPMRGMWVRFSIADGGGSIAIDSVRADTLGVASSGAWTLGTIVGTNALKADVSGVGTVTLTATGQAGPAKTVTVVSGDAQSGEMGARLTDSLVVRATDRFGNAVEGATILWETIAGGGSVGLASSVSRMDGTAKTSWLLGPRLDSVQVTQAKLPDEPAAARFTASPQMPATAKITIQEGEAQAAEVATAVTTAPRVLVRLADDRPVRGAWVRFIVTAGGGAIATDSGQTNSEGLTSGGTWTLGTVVGANRLEARHPALPSTVVTATALPASPVVLQVSGAATGAAGVELPVTIRARDRFGNISTGYRGEKTLTLSGAKPAPSGALPTGGGISFGQETKLTFTDGATTLPFVPTLAESAALAATDGTLQTPDSLRLRIAVSPGIAATIVLDRPTVALPQPGDTALVKATVKDAFGNQLIAPVMDWASTDAQIVTVLTSGFTNDPVQTPFAVLRATGYTGAATRTTTATGSIAATIGTTSVTVSPSKVARLALGAASIRTQVGETTQLVAKAYDSAGNELQNRNVTWAANNTAVASVTESGLLTGVALGETKFHATFDAVSEEGSVVVRTLKGGTIVASETWSFEVDIASDLRIANGARVTVDAGTQVNVKEGVGLQILVEGELVTNGTEAAPVVFQGDQKTSATSRWIGIRLRNTQNSLANENGWVRGTHLRNVIIRNAGTAVYVYKQGIAIEGAILEHNEKALEIRQSDGVFVKNSTFRRNQYGIFTEYESYSPDPSGNISNTWLLNNNFVSNQTAIQINPNQRSTNNLNINNNWFDDNVNAVIWGNGGYGAGSSSPVIIRENDFWSNQYAIQLQAYGGTYDIQISQNGFGDNGIAVMSGSTYDKTTVKDNFFYKNDVALYSYSFGITATIENNLSVSDLLFYRVAGSRGSDFPRLLRNRIHGVQGRILDIDGGLAKLQFEQNVVTSPLGTGYWFWNISTASFTLTSNYIDWGSSNPSEKIYDGNDKLDFGVLSFESPLSSISGSSSTRSLDEITSLTQRFSKAIPKEQRLHSRTRTFP